MNIGLTTNHRRFRRARFEQRLAGVASLGTLLLTVLLSAELAAAGDKKKGPPRHLIIQAPSATPMYGDSQGASIQSLPPLDRTALEIVVENDLLTCSLRNAPLEEVLRSIGKQTGVQFVHGGRLHANISANLRNLPIEKAIELLLQDDSVWLQPGRRYLHGRPAASQR